MILGELLDQGLNKSIQFSETTIEHNILCICISYIKLIYFENNLSNTLIQMIIQGDFEEMKV